MTDFANVFETFIKTATELETSKTLEQKFIYTHGINEHFSFDYFILVFHVIMLPPIA